MPKAFATHAQQNFAAMLDPSQWEPVPFQRHFAIHCDTGTGAVLPPPAESQIPGGGGAWTGGRPCDRDADLLTVHPFRGIAILFPAAFLEHGVEPVS